MTDPIPKHQRTARGILAAWRRNRPKKVADAISGSAAFELVEAIEGSLVMLDDGHQKVHELTSAEKEEVAAQVQELNDTKMQLEQEVASLRRKLGLIEEDLAPGATAEDARSDCSVCGDTGFEVFNMEVIPCRGCVGSQ